MHVIFMQISRIRDPSVRCFGCYHSDRQNGPSYFHLKALFLKVGCTLSWFSFIRKTTNCQRSSQPLGFIPLKDFMSLLTQHLPYKLEKK